MRLRTRFTITIGLALAVAAIVPVAAYAATQIPYLSQGQGVTSEELGYPVTRSVDDRPFSRISEQPTVQIPYLSQGQGVTSAELGFPASKSPDDRAFARGKEQQLAPVVRSDSGIEVDTAAISGFGLAALLVAGGMSLAIRSRRRTRLSPA